MWNRLSALINIKVVLYVRTVAKSATFNPVNILSVYICLLFSKILTLFNLMSYTQMVLIQCLSMFQVVITNIVV